MAMFGFIRKGAVKIETYRDIVIATAIFLPHLSLALQLENRGRCAIVEICLCKRPSV